MKTTIFQVRVLESEEGTYLTQSNLKEGTFRTFSKKVFLAQETSPDEWRTASEQETREYEASIEV